jgi:hypothetical protein
MTIDALRRELLHEGIRQQFIVAELAKRQELEDEFHARFRQTTMPHRCKSPPPHGGPVAGSSMSRRPVKDRIEEWYQPPWCREIHKADAPIAGVSSCLSFTVLHIQFYSPLHFFHHHTVGQYILNNWDAGMLPSSTLFNAHPLAIANSYLIHISYKLS